jgi:hypothetical protein
VRKKDEQGKIKFSLLYISSFFFFFAKIILLKSSTKEMAKTKQKFFEENFFDSTRYGKTK